MEDVRGIVELLLAINILILSINQSKLSKRIRELSDNVIYLTLKEMIREEGGDSK